MLSIANKPLMDWMLRLLKMHEVDELMVSAYQYPEEIRDYFGDGSRWALRVWYSHEPALSGNAAHLKRLEGFFGNQAFIVLDGGILSDIDIGKLIDFHKDKRASMTVGLVKKENSQGRKIYLAEDGVRINKLQKDYLGRAKEPGYKSCGVCVLESRIFEYIPEKKPFDFEEDLLPELLKTDEEICGFVHDGYWLDVRSLGDFREANFDILSKRVNIKTSGAGALPKDGIWVGERTEIHKSVQMRPPVSIGNDCLIREGTRLVGPAIIGDHSIIDKDVTFQRAIVWGRGYIGKDSRINGALIGDSTYISSDVEICEEVTVGLNCIVGPRSRICEGVTLRPGTVVAKDSKVDYPTGNKTKSVCN